MKNIFILPILMYILSSQSRQNSINQDCNENMEFKKFFFQKIACIEKTKYGYVKDTTLRDYDGTLTEETEEAWFNCLDTISMYAPVSWGDILQIHVEYHHTEVYESDKKGWYEWYEKNKCNNIQIKKRGKT